MKWLLLLLLLFPGPVFAMVSGIDDINPNISQNTQFDIDEAITSYYQHPTVSKVDTVLTIMNESDLLRKKTAWAPLIGFLSVVFEHQKKHIFHWMALNEYNTFAQDIFVTALLHASLNETALVFARAHQWPQSSLDNLQAAKVTVDLKHLDVTLPGHIDTLWGAFFASGDRIYVNEIIDVLFDDRPEPLSSPGQPRPADAPKENKKLAETTLRQYATQHKPVHKAIEARIASEKDKAKKDFLKQLLTGSPDNPATAH